MISFLIKYTSRLELNNFVSKCNFEEYIEYTWQIKITTFVASFIKSKIKIKGGLNRFI